MFAKQPEKRYQLWENPEGALVPSARTGLFTLAGRTLDSHIIYGAFINLVSQVEPFV